jgi:S1-C subfamily serine protease
MAICFLEWHMGRCRYNIVFCLLNFGLAALAQNSLAATASSVDPDSATEIHEISASVVRVTATFSYQEQEDPNATSGFRKVPFDPSATAQGGPGQILSWTSSGTGFIVDSDGHIATANHVISPLLNQEAAEHALKKAGKILGPGSFQRATINVIVQGRQHEQNDYYYVDAKVFKKSDRFDIAILTCRRNLLRRFSDVIPPLSVPEFQKDAPRSGDLVSVSGFPTASGSDVGYLTTNTGIVSTPVFKDALGRNFYLADVGLNRGDSGAPVFMNTSGRIIGVVDASVSAGNGTPGRIEIIPIRQILDLLPAPAR